MKKIIIVVVGVLIVIGMFAIMFSNRAKNQAKAKSVEILTVIPVSVEQASKEKINEKLNIIGTVTANAEVTVMSEAQGRIVAVNFDVGHNVGKGSELVKMDDELKAATLSSAKATFEKAEKDLTRYENLIKEKTVNETQYEAAKLAYATTEAAYNTAKRQYNDTRVKAPINGVVTERKVEVGSFVNVGNPIATIVDISTLKVKLNVPERDVFKMKTGDAVEIKTDVYPNVVFSGKIKSISAKADDAHTYPVEVTLQNNNANPLRAGMFARVFFNTVTRDETLLIPRTALVGSIRTPQVYVIEGDVARLRNITIGSESGDKIEVLSGLNPGETVVTNGQINLQDNVKVKIVK